jgi:hypothetical protein
MSTLAVFCAGMFAGGGIVFLAMALAFVAGEDK